MTIGQIIGSVAAVITVLSVFVEIVPVKINPVSKILDWVGKKMVGELTATVEAQGQKLDNLDNKIDNNEIDRIRWEILDFANSCRNNRHHSQDEFEHVIKLHEKYHKIIEERKLTNGLITLEYEYIQGIYRNCQKNNSFL